MVIHLHAVTWVLSANEEAYELIIDSYGELLNQIQGYIFRIVRAIRKVRKVYII
jgi:hypothetical protein